jgi:hypothetical protein
MPELTITSPFVHSRVDSNTFTMGNPVPESTLKPYARVDIITLESTSSPNQGCHSLGHYISYAIEERRSHN